MGDLLLWASARLKHLTLSDRLLRRHPVHYAEARRQLERFAAADLDGRRHLMQERLAMVLRAAARTAHGRGIVGASRLSSWPLIDKQTVRGNPQAFRQGAGWLSARARTSGTTGAPLELVRSNASVAFEQAAIDSVIERLGADPEDARIAVLRGERVDTDRERLWEVTHAGRRLTLSSYHLSRETIDGYARILAEFRPDLLCAYPSALESLCRLLVARGHRLAIPRVVCSSEVLETGAWELARGVLGCEMADYYGLAERVAFAFATRPGEYRFLPGYGFVELLPAGAEGAHEVYEIVGTSLWNLAMPLVRYRTGDLIRAPAGLSAQALEEIALGCASFDGIVGRSADVLLLPDGARLTSINHIPRDLTRIAALQIVQEALDHVCIRVVPGPSYGAADADAFLERARSALPGALRVSIEATECLERGPLGKTPVVVHRPAVRRAMMAAAPATVPAAQTHLPAGPSADAGRGGGPARR